MTIEARKYLESIDFIENNWGFLTNTIQDIKYTFANDPFVGYTLIYSYIKNRTASQNEISLGRQPTENDIKNTFLKILVESGSV